MASPAEKQLNKLIGKVIIEKNLICDGDRILIALSGGKDSWTLVDMMNRFRKKAPVNFDCVVVTLDVYLSDGQKRKLKKGMSNNLFSYHIYKNQIDNIIETKLKPGTSVCALCARMRRAYLYKAADDYGCNKVALGHHLDDLLETFFMNMLYHGTIKGMPVHIHADNGRHQLIRPLLYCPEDVIGAYAKERKFPIIRCRCSMTNIPDTQRWNMKKLLKQLEAKTPGIKRSLLTALHNVSTDHLI